MNWDQIEGQWKTLKGSVRNQWGKLTDQDFESIAGKREILLGKLQERYGLGKDKAESELNDFLAVLDNDKRPASTRTSTSRVGGSSNTSNTGKSHDPSSIRMNMDV